MIAAGLVEEIAALRRLALPVSREAAQAVGCREICGHLDGRLSLEDAVRLIQTRSRQFARRQLTWFRQLRACRPVEEVLTYALWGLTILEGKSNSQSGTSPFPPPML